MIRLDAKTPLGRFIRRPLRWIPSDTVLPVLSGPLRGTKWIVGSAPHGAWIGSLERDKLSHFHARLSRDAIVWDIGANVGLYALCAARRARRVFAFEPIEANLAYLRRHLEINAVGNVVVEAKAIVEHDGHVRMAPGDSASEWKVDPQGSCRVEAVSLDSWRNREGSSMPQLLKIDVEGAEVEVIRGAIATLEAAHPLVYLALHGERQSVECRTLLESLDYRIVSLESGLTLEESSEWYAEWVQ